jgi:hypothetical protein
MNLKSGTQMKKGSVDVDLNAVLKPLRLKRTGYWTLNQHVNRKRQPVCQDCQRMAPGHDNFLKGC